MIHVISPFGEGVKGISFAFMRGLIYLVGSAVGGAVTGGALATLGSWLLPSSSMSTLFLVVGGIGLLVGVRDLWSLPLPQRAWQVPRHWVPRFGPMMSSALFGLCLGSGWLTYAPFGCFHLLQMVIFVRGDFQFGVALGLLYGLLRALPVPLASLTETVTGTKVNAIVDTVMAQYSTLKRASGVLLVASSTWALLAGLV